MGLENKTFNKKNTYREKIEPVVNQLAALCENYDIPFYFTTCTANTPEKSTYETQVISPKSYGYAITEDHFIEHENVSNGFKTELSRKPMEIDCSDFSFPQQ